MITDRIGLHSVLLPLQIKLSDLYTLPQSKLLENHTLHSGTYLYSPYMAVLPGFSSRALQILIKIAFSFESAAFESQIKPQGPKEMCLSLKPQNQSKTSKKNGLIWSRYGFVTHLANLH